MLLKSDPISDGILRRFTSNLETLMKRIEALHEREEVPDSENYVKSVGRLCELARSVILQRGSADLFSDDYIAKVDDQFIDAAEKIRAIADRGWLNEQQRELITAFAENIESRATARVRSRLGGASE